MYNESNKPKTSKNMEAFQQRGLRRTLSALNSVRHSDMKSGEAISK
jgi:hypothetical protein